MILKVKTMKKQRRFTFEKDDIEIMVDFGKEGSEDYTCEVVSRLLPNSKKEVLSAKTLGRARKWDMPKINGYLTDFYECKDIDEEGDAN